MKKTGFRPRLQRWPLKVNLEPGESKTITFMLTWHFPNRRAWGTRRAEKGGYGGEEIVGNYYTTLYRDAWDVAARTASELGHWKKKR